MFEFIIIFILLVAILVLLIYGIFIKPAITYDDYKYEENGDENEDDIEIEEEELPSTIGYHKKKPSEEVSISKSPTGQFLLKIKSTTYPELFPASEGSQIVLNIMKEGIMVDYYYPTE